jgi:choline dehydrogenase-like flavoprotein
MEKNKFDVIVVGSGMTGGWAAKEFTEKGYETLVLERGREVEHIRDYKTTNSAPWEFKYRKYDSKKVQEEQYMQRLKYNFDEASKDFFVNDKDHPIESPDDKPAKWFRGYQSGGRSLLWGRGTYRMSDYDFERNVQDGNGSDWPIRYKDIAPWYDYIETNIGVSGTNEDLEHYPDGKYLPPFDMNVVEKEAKTRLENHYSDRKLVPNRVAHLTKIKPGQFPGRSECQSRDMCHTGCPFGAYFSSNSSTLPAAKKTGKLTGIFNSIVDTLIYDKKKNKVIGVRVINSLTDERTEFYARVIFLCASTLATTSILMRSKNETFPNGLANTSGVLGHYLMDHHKDIGGTGIMKGFENKYYRGFRPGGLAIPGFRNFKKKEKDFSRSYGVWGGASRVGINPNQVGIGKEFKEKLTKPGAWTMGLYAFGECIPYYENRVELNAKKKDKWGLPILNIIAEFKENEMKMREDMKKQVKEMMEVMGLEEIKVHANASVMGDSVHMAGTARMGRDPKTSVLNEYNQCHDIKNLFVTDGACMPSISYKSPSLTFMALTARAADYAMKKMELGEF